MSRPQPLLQQPHCGSVRLLAEVEANERSFMIFKKVTRRYSATLDRLAHSFRVGCCRKRPAPASFCARSPDAREAGLLAGKCFDQRRAATHEPGRHRSIFSLRAIGVASIAAATRRSR